MGNFCYRREKERLEIENNCLKLQVFYLKEIIIKKEQDLDKLKKYIIINKKKIKKIHDNIF